MKTLVKKIINRRESFTIHAEIAIDSGLLIDDNIARYRFFMHPEYPGFLSKT